jgi:hypothetical protein
MKEFPNYTRILLHKKRLWDYFVLFSVFNIYSYRKPLTAEDGIYYHVLKDDFLWSDFYKNKTYLSTKIFYDDNGETLIKPYYCSDVKQYHKINFKYIVEFNRRDEKMYDDLMNAIYKFGFNDIRRLILNNSKSYHNPEMFHYFLFKKILEKDIQKDSIFLLLNFIKNMRFNYLKEYVPEIFHRENLIEDYKHYNKMVNEFNINDKKFYDKVFKYYEL